MLWGHPLRVDAFALGRGLGLAAFLVACRPSIGDPCVTSLDCSQQGDRLCDASQPAGYCTIFNCLPDQCPDNAACVGFGAAIDPKCTTYDPRQPRFEQTFCMKPCLDNTDCRAGYECHAPSERRGVQIDLTEPYQTKRVCFPATTAPPDLSSNADTCKPPGGSASSSTGG